MFCDIFGAIFFLHRGFETALHLLGFAAQHGGLVRHADGLQMQFGIEPLRIRAFEPIQKFPLVTTMNDVVADVIGFREVEDNEIMSAAVGPRLRTGGLGFLVPRLAVNDARDAFL